jgi:hypothetical protein
MLKLTDRQIADYFHRSYTAVDGLWFMKVEAACGFDTALDIDTGVWKVMPKIQARMTTCPWVDLLAKANRQHLAEKIGTRICDPEYAVWAGEFGPDIRVEFADRLCKGCSTCTVRFT